MSVLLLNAEAVKANRRITPPGEWLLDNFYLIEEQIRTARRHLPKGYGRELPRLTDCPSASRPRVYDIALEVRFLANREANLYFGLLTDFRDAETEGLPEDAALLRLARQGIEALNNNFNLTGH